MLPVLSGAGARRRLRRMRGPDRRLGRGQVDAVRMMGGNHLASVLELILEAKTRGASILGIFDAVARARVADRPVDASGFAASAA